MDKEFQKLLSACAEVSAYFPDGVVFIGGIAVYLHAINHSSTAALAEATHDADFYVSFADMADLREIEEVTPNRRLSKHQMVKHGFEFDIYTERQSSLIVPFDAVVAHSKVYGGLRAAALEHLLALKLEAFADRKGSAKGDKDARDLLRICAIAAAEDFHPALAAPYLGDEHLELLRQVAKSPQATALADGNAQRAKVLRQQAQSVLLGLEATMHKPHPPEEPNPCLGM
ncbi:MAG: hypothetical protein HKL99_14070 [Burkholderiales bacterium]|nr:hypothetical protein [Burkholderiales bacterium]